MVPSRTVPEGPIIWLISYLEADQALTKMSVSGAASTKLLLKAGFDVSLKRWFRRDRIFDRSEALTALYLAVLWRRPDLTDSLKRCVTAPNRPFLAEALARYQQTQP